MKNKFPEKKKFSNTAKTTKKKKKKKKEEIEEEKVKLSPSWEVMKRIKHDPVYNPEQFVIRYMDRFVGMQEMPYLEFIGGEVPIHRIWIIKLNGHIVWDREKRIDLLANGDAKQFITVDSGEEDEEEGEEDNTNEELGDIIFSTSKNRKIYQQYKPKDHLEKFLLKNNQKSSALIDPNYISQLGGYYKIEEELFPELLVKWEKDISERNVFYMEEKRTDVFRLYLDFDFKMTNGKPYSMEKWIKPVQYCVNRFFGSKIPKELNTKLNSNVLVCESHSTWKDTETKDANYKSGFRFYYTFIYVDKETMVKFTKILGDVLEEQFKTYEGAPKGWKFEDIVDMKHCTHEKARMFGSTKHRRGKDLGRTYKLQGYYNNNGEKLDKFEKVLASDLQQTLLLSTVRKFDGIDQFFTEKQNDSFKKIKTLIFKNGEKAVFGKSVIRKVK